MRAENVSATVKLLFLLLGIALLAGGARGSSCRGVPLEIDNFIIVPVSIDGRSARLVLDPIRNVLLDSAYAIETGIETISSEEAGFGPDARVGGAGEEEQIARFAPDLDLRIGEHTIALSPVLVLDLRTPLGPSFENVSGLLGTDLFREHVLVIDLKERCLTLHDKEGAPYPDSKPLRIIRERNRPTVDGQIELPDGERVPVRFLLDFGMVGGVRFSTRFVNDMDLTERLQTSVPDRMETGLGGELDSLQAMIPAVTIGNLQRSDLEVRLARETSGADADPPWDALIGVGMLRSTKIVYDPAGDRVWLSEDDE